MVIVAAVGKGGASSPAMFPAALPNVAAVTAVDADGRIFRNAVRGPHVDFAAPSVDIFLPSMAGGRYATGTSMAAPFVTARLAARAERNPNALRSTVVDLGFPGRDPIYGFGLVQAAGACG